MDRVELPVTVVIPTYNEEGAIIQGLEKLWGMYSHWHLEVIVSDDGSTDNTVDRVVEFSRTHPGVRVLESAENRGRGEAVSAGFLEAGGKILAFLDADMATDLAHLKEMAEAVAESYDICIGSRWQPGSVVARSFSRLLISKGFNVIVRLLFRSPLSDHQCGFKAFKREVALALVRECGTKTNRGWMWDTEMLLRAQIKGFSIHEIPVRWHAGRESKFKWRRDIIGGLIYLIGLRLEFRKEERNRRLGKENIRGDGARQ